MDIKEFRKLYCKEENRIQGGKFRFICEFCGQEFIKHPSDSLVTVNMVGSLVCGHCGRSFARNNQSTRMGPEGRKAAKQKALETLGSEGRRQARIKQNETMGHDSIVEARKKVAKTIGSDGYKNMHRKRVEKITSCSSVYPTWFISSLAYEKDRIRASEGFININEYLTFTCAKCGCYFERKVYNTLYKGTMKPKGNLHKGDQVWCRRCGKSSNTGKTEQRVFDKLSEIYRITKEPLYFPKVNGGRGNYEGDIVCEEGKWCIEIDGTYWHTEGNKVPFGYHHDKDLSIEAKGYRVLHVTTEWVDEDFDRAICYICNWVDNSLPTVHSEFDTVNNSINFSN